MPFDADEWWVPTLAARGAGHETIASVLATLTHPTVVSADVFQHRSWDARFTNPQELPKVAFSAQPHCRIVTGDHAVTGHPGRVRHGLLEVRELQFRSEDHYVAKMQARVATLRPNSPRGENDHYKRVTKFTEAELRADYYAWYCNRPTAIDPIPSEWRPQ